MSSVEERGMAERLNDLTKEDAVFEIAEFISELVFQTSQDSRMAAYPLYRQGGLDVLTGLSTFLKNVSDELTKLER